VVHVRPSRGIIRTSTLLLATAAFLAASVASAAPSDGAAARADRLGHAALTLVRAGAAGAFEDLVTRLDAGRFSKWVATGGGPWAEQISGVLKMAEEQKAAPRADPAAGLLAAFRRRKMISGRWSPGKLEAYAAALQVILENRREIRMKLGLVDLLLEIGAPVMLSDLGLSRTDPTELRGLAAEAAQATDPHVWSLTAEDFFRGMVQLDDLGGRFGHRSDETDLAARLMATREFERLRNKLAALPPARLCFFGDSQTDNRHWSSPAHYPAILAEVFRQVNPGLKAINAGVGGDDSGEGLARIDRDVLGHHPDLCFVLFGGNDCSYHGGKNPAVSPEQFYRNMSEITARLQAGGCKPVLMTYPLAPANEPRERGALTRMNQELARVRRKYDTGWLPVGRLIGARDSRWMFAVDGLHLSPAAHQEISLAILRYLTAGAGAMR